MKDQQLVLRAADNQVSEADRQNALQIISQADVDKYIHQETCGQKFKKGEYKPPTVIEVAPFATDPDKAIIQRDMSKV